MSAELILFCIPIALTLTLYYWRQCRNLPVYLLDFACYKGPRSLEGLMDKEQYHLRTYQMIPDGPVGIPEDMIQFQTKLFLKSGISQSACIPHWKQSGKSHLNEALGGESCFTAALREARMVLFGSVREVLQKTGLHPEEIDCIVLNCSLFNPQPGMTTMVSERFGMREDVQQYTLCGMGCSAGILSLDLARTFLGANANKTVLVLSTEITSQNWYRGMDRDKQLPNVLFRMGAVASILTNKASERRRCKYVLEHIVRIHEGADPMSYRCVHEVDDSQGIRGVSLSKDIVKVAAKALQKNLTLLAPLVLPYSELFQYLLDAAFRKLRLRQGKAYQPDFQKAFTHFILHTGGRGVIQGLGSQLKLSKKQLEPNFSSLNFFGNTSSASIFYGLGYAENKQGMRKGDRVWQVGFGSGFKVNSAVWRSLRSFQDLTHAAWKDVTAEQIAAMWSNLEGCGVKFVNGVLHPPASQR